MVNSCLGVRVMRGHWGGQKAALAGVFWHLMALLPVATLATPPFPAKAEEPAVPKYGWREVWTGADAMRDVWLLYTGITLAPWNEHVYEPGFRLRVQSGYGRYAYELEDGAKLTTHTATVTFGDVLAGYHWRTGDLTAKLFAGVSFIDHIALASASRGRLRGLEWGPKVATELWLDIGRRHWTSLNASFTTAHDTASLRLRYGYRVLEGLSIGPELRADTNSGLYKNYGDIFNQFEGRAGAFAVYAWDGYELSLAAGAAAFVKGFGAAEISPYATVNFLMEF